MADDENLVSEVRVDGADVAAKALSDYGDKGKEAFDKVADAAEKAGKKVSDATDSISGGLDDVSKAADKVGGAVDDVGAFGKAFIEMSSAVGSSIQAVGSFGASIVAVSAALKGAVVGVAKFAASATSSFRTIRDASSDNTKEQMKLNAQQVQGIASADGYNNSLTDLRLQLGKGKLDYVAYNQAVLDLNKSYDRQVATQRKVQEAQIELQQKNEKLQEIKARNDAYKALVKTYGGPLTASLVTLGDTYDSVKNKIIDAFGPQASRLVDAVNALIEKNLTTVTRLIDVAAASLSDFITKSGPSIEQVITFVDGLAKGILLAVTSVILPAFKALLGVVNSVATLLNGLFGTNFTGPVLIGAAAIFYMAGGFTALVSIVNLARTAVLLFQAAALGPVGLAIAAVVLVIGALVAAFLLLDWKKYTTGAAQFAAGVVNYLKGLPATITGFFSTLWTGIVALADLAVQGILLIFSGLLLFFTNFPQIVTALFRLLWTGITTLAKGAADGVVAAFNAVVEFFRTLPATIGPFFVSLWALIKAGWDASIIYVTAQFNALITFFQNLPATVAAFFNKLWDDIKAGVLKVYNDVTGYFTKMFENAKKTLLPIIEWLNKINNAGSGADTTTGQPAAGFASGGHVRGPGTSTSDSIAAWLSNNEFVVRAKAVRKYGTSLLNAINSGQLDTSKMLGFAAGGLVTMPNVGSYGGGGQFASVGATTVSRTPINLTIGGEQYNGLLAPSDVADRLVRHATAKRVTSAGRPPGWKG